MVGKRCKNEIRIIKLVYEQKIQDEGRKENRIETKGMKYRKNTKHIHGIVFSK